jgi:transposase-like protein
VELGVDQIRAWMVGYYSRYEFPGLDLSKERKERGLSVIVSETGNSA